MNPTTDMIPDAVMSRMVVSTALEDVGSRFHWASSAPSNTEGASGSLLTQSKFFAAPAWVNFRSPPTVWTAVGAAQAGFVAGDSANLKPLRNS